LGAFFLRRRPSNIHTSFPFSNDCVTHSFSFLSRHCACVCFEVHVGFAWTITSDDFVEASIRGFFQHAGNKRYRIVEGSIPFDHFRFLTGFPGPVIGGNVESRL
jgi:hypothetical protein